MGEYIREIVVGGWSVNIVNNEITQKVYRKLLSYITK
jgi:hypothetical protein